MWKKLAPLYALIVLFLVLAPYHIKAQKQSSRFTDMQTAADHIKKLKEGVLVVVISSNHKKMEAMETLLQSDDLSEKSKKSLQKKIQTIRETTRLQNEQTIKAFEKNYILSDVNFIYDSDLHLLGKGTESGLFLNDQLEKDINISVKGINYYVAKFDYVGEAKIHAIGIYSPQLKLLPKPFPATSRSSSLVYFLGRIFSPKKAFEDYINGTAFKLNKTLVRFHERYVQ